MISCGGVCVQDLCSSCLPGHYRSDDASFPCEAVNVGQTIGYAVLALLGILALLWGVRYLVVTPQTDGDPPIIGAVAGIVGSFLQMVLSLSLSLSLSLPNTHTNTHTLLPLFVCVPGCLGVGISVPVQLSLRLCRSRSFRFISKSNGPIPIKTL